MLSCDFCKIFKMPALILSLSFCRLSETVWITFWEVNYSLDQNKTFADDSAQEILKLNFAAWYGMKIICYSKGEVYLPKILVSRPLKGLL